MNCPKCQSANTEDAIFCNKCGNKLEIVCPECRKANPPGSYFCNKCGCNLPLSSEPSPKELSFDEKLDKIQRYLPKGLAEKILAQRNKIEGEHGTTDQWELSGGRFQGPPKYFLPLLNQRTFEENKFLKNLSGKAMILVEEESWNE